MKPVTRTIPLLFVVLHAAVAYAQFPGFEKVLFPIVIPLTQQPVQGALGSRWTTDVSVLNRADVEVPLAGQYVCFGCRTPHGLVPNVTYDLVPVRPPGDAGGSFLFVDSRYIDQVHFALRIRDTSREADGFGSEVPVVREHEFHSEGVSILGVPNRANARLTLRVYGLDAGLEGRVAIRVYEQRVAFDINLIPQAPPDALVAERTYDLARVLPSSEPTAENFPTYAQVSDLPLPAGIRPFPGGPARIDVIPLTPGLRIWAMASVTNNDTQQVTIISPR